MSGPRYLPRPGVIGHDHQRLADGTDPEIVQAIDQLVERLVGELDYRPPRSPG